MHRILCFVNFIYMVLYCQGLTVSQNSGQATTIGVQNQGSDVNIQPITSQDVLNSFQQMITEAMNGLENRVEDKILALENRLEDRNTYLLKILTDKNDMFENRIDKRLQAIEDKFDTFQAQSSHRSDTIENTIELSRGQLYKDVDARIDQFQNRLDSKLDALENRVEDKLDINSNVDKLAQIEVNLSKEISLLQEDVKTLTVDNLKDLSLMSNEIFTNFSDNLEKTLYTTLDFLISGGDDDRLFKQFDENTLAVIQNYTESIYEILKSGEFSARCPNDNSSDSNKDPLLLTCHRGMGSNSTGPLQSYEQLMDFNLNRTILCDTETDGGGWIVFQRRIKGDVNFYRTWYEYKHGFGEAPGDFWLGNDALHELTSKDEYELRIDLKVNGQDLFANYTSFKIESESDNYRLSLGSYSGTIGENSTRWGFSFHNGEEFSTLDRDNDKSGSESCAVRYHGAWWYGDCYTANLNGKWGVQNFEGVMWDTASVDLYPSSTEMKIRRK